MSTIAILALQGAFVEHRALLERLGCECFEIRQKRDLERAFDGLILVGGESTTMGLLLEELELLEPLRSLIEDGLPVFGTCAGMILLAKHLENDERVHFGTMDIAVMRNAFGRQYDSFFIVSPFDGKPVEMPFIRAPIICDIGEGVEVLSQVNGHVVAARQGNQLACAFHPELTENTSVHEYFLTMVQNS